MPPVDRRRDSRDVPTYRELAAQPGFAPLFLNSAAQVAGTTVSGIGLSVLVFGETGSPLLAALSMFGPSLAQVIGATTLLSAADRLRPRATLAGLAMFLAATTALQALPTMPIWAVFVLLMLQGLPASLGGGVRFGLLRELLPQDTYTLGRSTINASVGVMQILGFTAGGILIAAVSARGTLVVGAALLASAAVIARTTLAERAPRSTGRATVSATHATNRLLWRRPRRVTFLASWIPNGLIVGCEALFVPLAPDHAGTLLGAAALGMLVGDVVAGRLVPARLHAPAVVPLLVVLALPYLAFAAGPPLPVLAGLAFVASTGFGSTLFLQERLAAQTPMEQTGHALGLQSAGMLTMQGVAAALSGTIAQLTSPAIAIAAMAGASLIVTVGLTFPLIIRPDAVVGGGERIRMIDRTGGHPGDRISRQRTN
jgi:predicted MFS family arabinose efflux permease